MKYRIGVPWNVFFLLRVLARKLVSPFGHPNTNLWLNRSDYFRVRLVTQTQISCWTVQFTSESVWLFSNNDGDAEDDTHSERWIYILPAKFAMSRSVQFPNGSKNVLTEAQHAMTVFNSKWKYEKLAVVVCVAQTRQIFVISRSCFAKDVLVVCLSSTALATNSLLEAGSCRG